MKKFDKCPNCGRKPKGGIIFSGNMIIYECKECGRLYCYQCEGKGDRCPRCSSNKRREAGMCYGR